MGAILVPRTRTVKFCGNRCDIHHRSRISACAASGTAPLAAEEPALFNDEETVGSLVGELPIPDQLNVGGFSDDVFEVVARFADGTLGADHWIGRNEAIEICVWVCSGMLA